MHRRVSECPRTFDERADHVGFIQIPERTVQNGPVHPLEIVLDLPLAFTPRGATVKVGCAVGSATSGRQTMTDDESRKTSQHAVRQLPESLLERRPA
jgi:hypothetical protein